LILFQGKNLIVLYRANDNRFFFCCDAGRAIEYVDCNIGASLKSLRGILMAFA